MNRSEWTQIKAKKQITIDFMYADNTGKISLFQIHEIAQPFCKKRGSKVITLAEQDYYWLQLAMERDFAWFTVMFDPEGRLLEIYIDVTACNHTGCKTPWFEDLYIDYIVNEQGFQEVDQNELNKAYETGLITENQYQSALIHAKLIRLYLPEHHDQLIEFFKERFEEMRCLLEEE